MKSPNNPTVMTSSQQCSINLVSLASFVFCSKFIHPALIHTTRQRKTFIRAGHGTRGLISQKPAGLTKLVFLLYSNTSVC